MPTPEPIGKVRYTEPRGVRVREAGNIEENHSAIYGTVAIYTDMQTEGELIIDNWKEIMTVINDKVHDIITRNG